MAEKVKSRHRERIRSYEILPPHMSELRLVLLGNSSSGTCSVGNFLLDKTVFTHSDCQKSSGQYRGKSMVLVKTPNLLHTNLTEASVSALMEDCVEHSAPGPHVFILVLQPEDFTEQQKTRLQSVLENFSDQAFQHSLLLLLPPRVGAADSLKRYKRQSPLKDVIKQCRFRYVKQKDVEPLELITRVGQIVKENNGEHVRPNMSSDALHLTPQTDVNVQAQTDGSGLNLILLGNSWSQRSSVGNLLLKKTALNTETKPPNFQTYEGEMHNQPLTVVNTP
uniref:AIG1-type G domain-containing protein n=1 Tax=Neogobius melanostomus TaxID=47308 RepID=A0A8C6WWG5_9GOBI